MRGKREEGGGRGRGKEGSSIEHMAVKEINPEPYNITELCKYSSSKTGDVELESIILTHFSIKKSLSTWNEFLLHNPQEENGS